MANYKLIDMVSEDDNKSLSTRKNKVSSLSYDTTRKMDIPVGCKKAKLVEKEKRLTEKDAKVKSDFYENLSRVSKEMASAMKLIASSHASYCSMMQRKLQEDSDFQVANAMISSDIISDKDMGRTLMREICKRKTLTYQNQTSSYTPTGTVTFDLSPSK